MKKLVYTVQGLQDAAQEQLLCELLPEVLRAFGSDGKITADALSASISFGVPRNVSCAELEQSINAAIVPHGMQLLPPPNVRYYAYTGKKDKTKRKTVSVSAFVTSLISAVAVTLVITMLLTALVTGAYWDAKYMAGLPGISGDGQSAIDTETLDVIDYLIDKYSYDAVDDEALMQAVLKAYVAATGDLYAEYYTQEEFDAMTSENQGQMQGIGVSVVNSTLEYNGMTYSVIEIIMVFPNSPAERAGIRPGDMVITVKHEGTEYSISQIGYTAALNYLRGVSGTKAEFTVMRKSGAEYEPIEYSVTREAYVSASITSRVSETDPSVGIVTLLQFDLTTPTQFEAAVDELKGKGCTKFVFDVRNNPGGDLESIKAVLSFFLAEKDLIVSTKDKNGTEEFDYVQVVKHQDKAYAGCDVTKEDIGKYADLTFTVLTNGNTASAAELFTATVRDYKLGTIIGQTTYGKGCMQSIFSLQYYGVEGGLKLTTKMYFPASGQGYHGVGITPDISVELSPEAQEYNLYVLPEALDNQLQTAIDHMNK
ncbi:MAG: hypothetical protein IJW70_08530 [Clostridia bacterium]|nr:hypothetical protein [Clostridia bacterium]